MTPKDLLMACGNTPEGGEAFNKVVVLALTFRQRLIDDAKKAVNATPPEKEDLRKRSQGALEEFYSLRHAILAKISNRAAKIGQEVPLDSLCNFKV